MFALSREVSILRLSAAMLAAAVLVLPGHGIAQEKGGLGVGVGVDLGGVKADVDATVGGERGLADVNAAANVGGENGIDADARANVAGARGLVDADVTASIGGRSGVTADVDANVGGSRGLVDADIGLGIGATPGGGGTAGAVDGKARDKDLLRQFSQFSSAERQQMLRRCRGIGGDGYDKALANLCRLLETAAR